MAFLNLAGQSEGNHIWFFS